MLRTDLLVILLTALLAAQTARGQSVEETESEAVEASSKPNPRSQSVDSLAAARLIVEKTNDFRVERDRSRVKLSPLLVETARYFASYMAKNDQYGHRADGRTPSERAAEFDYDYCLVSENIAYQYNSSGFATAELAERFVEVWKTSPRHRQNMLDDDVVETGVAVAHSEDTGYWYAVQMFGRPMSAAIEFSIANRSDTTVDYTIRDRTFELPPGYTRTHVRCRVTKTHFEFLASEGQAGTIQPSNGERLTIVRRNGTLDVKRQ